MADAARIPLRSGYEALSVGDLDRWLEGVAEDAELHEVAEMPDARVYRGRAELRGWAESAISVVEEWEWAPEALIHQDGDVYVLRVRLTLRGRGSGVPISQLLFHLLELRDGKVAVIRGFLSESEALSAVADTSR